nr:hypothetical protein BaRGS_015475 [Batillaria attramentaria]
MFFPKIPASWMEVVHTGTPAEFRFLKLKQIPFQDTKLQKQYDEVKSLCVDAKYPHFISSDAFRAKIFKVFQAAVDDFRRAKENKLSDRLHLALNQMLKMVSGRTHVHHFFIPDMDIMGEVPRDEREFLYIMFSIAQKLFRTKQD